MAVLDTSALLSWPIERCRNQIVSILQQTELLNVDEQRWLLIDSLDMDWRTASPEDREVVNELASKTGDFCLLYTSPSPRDRQKSRMPSSA